MDEYAHFLKLMKLSFIFLFRRFESRSHGKIDFQRFIAYCRIYDKPLCIDSEETVMNYLHQYGDILLDKLSNNTFNKSAKNLLKQAKSVIACLTLFQGYNLDISIICKHSKFTETFDKRLRHIIRNDLGTVSKKNRSVDSTLTQNENEMLTTTLFSKEFAEKYESKLMLLMALQTWIAIMTCSGARGIQLADLRLNYIYTHACDIYERSERNNWCATPILTAFDLPFTKSSSSRVVHLLCADHKQWYYDVGMMLTLHISMLCRRPVMPTIDASNGFLNFLASYMNGLADDPSSFSPNTTPAWYSLRVFGKDSRLNESNRDALERAFKNLLKMADIQNKERLWYLFRNSNIHACTEMNCTAQETQQAVTHSSGTSTLDDYYNRGATTRATLVMAKHLDKRKDYFVDYDFLIESSKKVFHFQPFYSERGSVPYNEPKLDWKHATLPIELMEIVCPGIIAACEACERCALLNIRDPRVDNILRFLIYKGIPQIFIRCFTENLCDENGVLAYYIPGLALLMQDNAFNTSPVVKPFIENLVFAKTHNMQQFEMLRTAMGSKDKELDAILAERQNGAFLHNLT